MSFLDWVQIVAALAAVGLMTYLLLAVNGWLPRRREE